MKDTLNLPKTSFSMKANLAQREPEALRADEESGLYERIMDETRTRPLFTMHDGPPYANGKIHIGHALNKVLKDMLVRARILSGHHCYFLPGWDCHGLPIEHQVEKKLGKKVQEISDAKFREICRLFAQEQINQQRKDFKRLNILAHWDHPYQTLDQSYEGNIVRSLAKIIENGHLVKGFKPVHWCIECASALAEAEVEYKDKSSESVDVAFALVDTHPIVQAHGPVSCVIWTTTPWTLPANQAIALDPEATYDLVSVGTQNLLIAASLRDACLLRYGIDEGKVLESYKGLDFKDAYAQHPFMSRKVPILMGDHVTMDAGTGCVHTAPSHGLEDFYLGKAHDLSLICPVGDDGCYIDLDERFDGLSVREADAIIIKELEASGHLLSHEKVNHSYPHCWRHKTPLIFRATTQWFIDMDKNGLRQQALDAIASVSWAPAWGQARISKMIEQRPDWCISRQRKWGAPLALIVHKETGDLHPEMPVIMEKIASLIEEKGMESWFESPLSVFLDQDADLYEKVNDTLDVWFDSGVTHACVLRAHDALGVPADVYLEGSDQHRGWFQSSLLTSIAMYGQAPYKKVITHGYAVDGEGKKMSKSIGNVMTPDEVIKRFGADILRLWVGMTDYHAELSISDEILDRVTECYRKLRNTSRFLLANLHDYDPKEFDVSKITVALDQWAVDLANQVHCDVQAAYEDLDVLSIVQIVHRFCHQSLGNVYLDVIKDRQYTMHKNAPGRVSAQHTMYYIIQMLAQWLAPIVPFTAQEIWKTIEGTDQDHVMLSTWIEPLDMSVDQDFWNHLLDIRDHVNMALEQARQEGAIKSGLSASVDLTLPQDTYDICMTLQDELKFFFICSEVSLHLGSEMAVQVHVFEGVKCNRCWHVVPSVQTVDALEEICPRCVKNLQAPGEVRVWA